MEKIYNIYYRGFRQECEHSVRIQCEESKVKEIATAIARGESSDYCYVEGADGYRLTICDCI